LNLPTLIFLACCTISNAFFAGQAYFQPLPLNNLDNAIGSLIQVGIGGRGNTTTSNLAQIVGPQV
jgi:hypothetical protein